MMRHSILIAFGAVAAFLAACAPETVQKEEPTAPEFDFSIAETSFSVAVDSSVFFGAELVRGTDVKTTWSVDGEKVAGTPSVRWTFSKLGVSKVNFLASNSLGTVEREYTVTVLGIPLVVSYSVEDAVVESVVGTPLEMAVTVVSGDKSTVHSWTLDGAEISDGLSFSKTFTEAEIGTHTLTYYGINVDGLSATRTWTVHVVDLPLEVNFTPADTALEAMETQSVNFAAQIVHGATGAVYSWKVNGSEVSTAPAFVYDCTAQGIFTITGGVTNGIGEKAEKSWTLTVTEKVALSLLFDDFEHSELGVNPFYKGNNVGGVSILQTVENPYKTAANPSDRVLVDKGSMMSNNSSGYFTFKVGTYPDGVTEIPESERAKYTKFRVKIYLGGTGFTPLLQSDISGSPRSAPSLINGVPFNPQSPSLTDWNAAIKTNDWNELVYDFSNPKYGDAMNHLGNTGQLQFRVFVDFNNNGKAGQDVYFDDFEFLE